MNEVKKIIRAFNERLRVARKKFGEDHPIVKKMIDRAKMISSLEWTDKGISTKKSNLEKINTPTMEKRLGKYVQKTSATKIIQTTLSPDQIKDKKNVGEIFKKVTANREICEAIWQEMYDAGFSVDECNDVYDALRAGDFASQLALYQDGKISLSELADAILSKKNDIYADVPDFFDDL